MKRDRQTSGRRQAAARFGSTDEIRSEVVRRTAVVVGDDARRAPLVAAAVAFLITRGGPDFRESEIEHEAERLGALLRARFGFDAEAAARGREAWEEISDRLEGLSAIPSAAFETYLAPLEGAGVAGSILYVAGPERLRYWFGRRYSSVAEAFLVSLRDGLELEVLEGLESIRFLDAQEPSS